MADKTGVSEIVAEAAHEAASPAPDSIPQLVTEISVMAVKQDGGARSAEVIHALTPDDLVRAEVDSSAVYDITSSLLMEPVAALTQTQIELCVYKKTSSAHNPRKTSLMVTGLKEDVEFAEFILENAFAMQLSLGEKMQQVKEFQTLPPYDRSNMLRSSARDFSEALRAALMELTWRRMQERDPRITAAKRMLRRL